MIGRTVSSLIRVVNSGCPSGSYFWDAIKTVPDWPSEIVADIQACGGQAAAGGESDNQKTYTVQAGDTLSKIAKDHLGSAGAYTRIFEANRDQLDDPNKIKPGQVLRIP